MGSTTPITDDPVVPTAAEEWVRSRIADREFELPLLPEVATRVIQLTSKVTTDAAELSAVLHRDQSFAGHVLRVANSPAMGSSVQIVSLTQAVSRIGLGRIAEIALAISVQGKLFNGKSHAGLMRGMWQHSMASGFYAKEVARSRRGNVESAFLCGLLHTVGKPLVLDILGDFEKSRDQALPDKDARELMERHHVALGVILCEEWGLPAPVTEAVQFHVDYDAAPNHGVLAMIVNLAGSLARLAVPTAERISEDEVRALAVVEELNLYPDDMSALFGLKETVREQSEAIG